MVQWVPVRQSERLLPLGCDQLLRSAAGRPRGRSRKITGPIPAATGIIRRLLQKADQTTRDEVEQLINGETIVKTVRQELTYRDIEDSIDNIWSVLYSTGYLTSRGRLPGKQMKLALPNREVRELFIRPGKGLVPGGNPSRYQQDQRASARRFLKGMWPPFRICCTITCGIPSACGIRQCEAA